MTPMEDELIERQPQWKMTSMEDDLNGRQPQGKPYMNKMTLAYLAANFVLSLAQLSPSLVK